MKPCLREELDEDKSILLQRAIQHLEREGSWVGNEDGKTSNDTLMSIEFCIYDIEKLIYQKPRKKRKKKK